MTSHDDRRRGQRVPLSPSFAEADPRTTTPVRDLSETGVMVVTNHLFPIGTRIELRFVVFPEAPELFWYTGRVVRHTHDPSGMGVEFDPLNEETRALVQRIIEHTQRSGRRRNRSRVTLESFDFQAKKI